MNFSQKFDIILKERNISNYEMSKRTGISDSLIGYWRKGERVPKADNLIIISNFLEVSVDYLLGISSTPNIKNIQSSNIVNGNNGNHSPLTIHSEEKLDEMSAELLKMFNDMSFEEKMEILNLVMEKTKNNVKGEMTNGTDKMSRM